MDKEPSQTPSLNQQILHLSRLSDRIRSRILQGDSEEFRSALDDLSRLAGTLARVSRQVNKRDEERGNLLALANIGQVINSSLELDEVLGIVMDTIIRLTGAERGFLMLRNQQGEMAIHIARNIERESLPGSDPGISNTVVNKVIAEGKPVLSTNAQEDPRFGSEKSIIIHNLRSILCVPLKVKGELTGVIYADNRVRTGLFTETELAMLSAFANQAAVAIENARLFDSVRRTLAEVTELKNLMDDVFASIASGVITLDLDDRITLCNQAAEEILRCTERNIAGRKMEEVLPQIYPELAPLLERVRRTRRQIVGLEFNLATNDCDPIALILNLSPLEDADHTTRGVAIVLDDLTEKKRLEAQRQLFERMVSPTVIEQLNPNELQLGGKRTEITTLFADIQGFTEFSENHDPEQLMQVLNKHLGAATEAVLKHKGTIDKFIGDAVMAFFNAPIPQDDHTLRAVCAALDMRAAILGFQDEPFMETSMPFGIGIHFGDAVLGLIGTEKRMEYTAIGDSVNTAKRIQENAAAGQILISERAYRQIANLIEARPVDAIQAKGKSQPLLVYEVIGLK